MSEDEQRTRLAIMIADTIRQLLRESDELTGLLQQAHQDGYDVLLSIVSGVVVRRKHSENSEDDEETPQEETSPLPEVFEFTKEDCAFLKSIGIQATE